MGQGRVTKEMGRHCSNAPHSTRFRLNLAYSHPCEVWMRPESCTGLFEVHGSDGLM
jgi:hypothetical protein